MVYFAMGLRGGPCYLMSSGGCTVLLFLCYIFDLCVFSLLLKCPEYVRGHVYDFQRLATSSFVCMYVWMDVCILIPLSRTTRTKSIFILSARSNGIYLVIDNYPSSNGTCRYVKPLDCRCRSSIYHTSPGPNSATHALGMHISTCNPT